MRTRGWLARPSESPRRFARLLVDRPIGDARGRPLPPSVPARPKVTGVGDDRPAPQCAPPPSADEEALLDPSTRQAAQLAPFGASPHPVQVEQALGTAWVAADGGGTVRLRAHSLEELLPALVRRIAWAGDRHRATVRLELGAGAHAGTTLVVHAEAGRVRVEAFGAEGAELDGLRARLDARLRRHGLDVESVT